VKRKRIGIIGGSFDPIHTGHLLIADAAVKQFRLDVLNFVPARKSPHKPNAVYASAKHRLEMVKACTKLRPRWICDDVELNRKGLSYSRATLDYMAEKYPDGQLYLLIGSDNLRSFSTWKDPHEIAGMAKLIVYQRWEHSVTASMLKRWRASLIKGPEIFISSTAVRNRCSSGRTIRHFVPPVVERYIRKHSLYLKHKRGS